MSAARGDGSARGQAARRSWIVFFFSSRRRHTRLQGDWSSDVCSSDLHDAKGTLIAAVRDNNPVLYVEHRMLHFQSGPVPEEPYTVAPGKARVTLPGGEDRKSVV